MTDGSQPGKSWLLAYATAFVLMLIAAAAATVAGVGHLRTVTWLWVSTAFSCAAFLAAIASLWLARRR